MISAGIAQLVEYKLPKLDAAGSIPVARSSSYCKIDYGLPLIFRFLTTFQARLIYFELWAWRWFVHKFLIRTFM